MQLTIWYLTSSYSTVAKLFCLEQCFLELPAVSDFLQLQALHRCFSLVCARHSVLTIIAAGKQSVVCFRSLSTI